MSVTLDELVSQLWPITQLSKQSCEYASMILEDMFFRTDELTQEEIMLKQPATHQALRVAITTLRQVVTLLERKDGGKPSR